jgi:RNA polymerase sigma-70 factor (ECF subfamily)
VHLLGVSPVRDAASPPLPAATPAWAVTARARLWRYLRFLGSDAALADDCAQEALLAALGQFGNGEPPIAWLLTTARNALRMHLRRAGREVADLEHLHTQWVEVAGDDGADARVLALRACLGELPARSRRALELKYGDDASRAAIGRELGLGDEGVKSLLVRLRAALAVCVQRRLGHG